VESEKYAAPPPRRRALTRAGAALAPALVLCIVVGAAGQVRRFDNAWKGFQGDTGQGATPPPISLRIGIMLSDPSTTAPTLAPALAVLALTGLFLARVRTAPVTGPVRRAGAVAAGLVGALGAALAVVVVGWVVTTHGTIGGIGRPGTDTTYSIDTSLQLDPWDTLAGQGTMGLLTAVVGAGAALLLGTNVRAARGGSASREDAGTSAPAASSGPAAHATSGAAGATGTGTGPGAHGSRASDRSAAPAPDLVVVASPPTVDLTAFRRPDPPASGDSGASARPGSPADGYRRPTERSRGST